MKARFYVEKKPGFQTEAQSVAQELKVDHLRVLAGYDVFGIDEKALTLLKEKVCADAVTDTLLESLPEGQVFGVEYLPGQYDQRADWASQCLSLWTSHQATIRSFMAYVFDQEMDHDKLVKHFINPVEAREKDFNQFELMAYPEPEPIPMIDLSDVKAIHQAYGLAMSLDDLAFVKDYFDKEGRQPTETELKVLDTYWSDHCRHTTFETELVEMDIKEGKEKSHLEAILQDYLAHRNPNKPLTLMDIATAGGKRLAVSDQEVSDEVNACSIVADIDGQEWLIMFKNETHNHPTEIEPFGGASTCIGGAIRDPLSGRAYVYQAMRITGAGDLNAKQVYPGKLPQAKISKQAALGYSSYGNQIGLATTFVRELFDDSYVAKRLEVGAVVGAVKRKQVLRAEPSVGDIILVMGGPTGRDGIGGATGSSKQHTTTSVQTAASEVQKGNAPTERKLQRLFRHPEVSEVIKKANDFGAGGVCVAVGELADSLDICLDTLPTKYAGLNGTELAISESQERMAILIDPQHKALIERACQQENLSCVQVAQVTDTGRLVMRYQDEVIVNLSRAFLNSAGVRAKVKVVVETDQNQWPTPLGDNLYEVLAHPHCASQIGLIEQFDSTVGKSTVLMPLGGKHQLTVEQASVQKIPSETFTKACTVLTYGFDPLLSHVSPMLSASYSVVQCLLHQLVVGANPFKVRLSNQEYFRRLTKASDWGQVVRSLLGLYEAQMAFGVPSIGGKDSMSGTYEQLNVIDTLISFGVSVADTDQIISGSLKEKGNTLYLYRHQPKPNSPDYEGLKHFMKTFMANKDKIVSAYVVQAGGIGEALAKMAFGSDLGFDVQVEGAFDYELGSVIIEGKDLPFEAIGQVSDEWILNGEKLDRQKAYQAWTSTFDALYPVQPSQPTEPIQGVNQEVPSLNTGQPLVCLPVFPGQNCEIDTRLQWERAGARVEELVFNNQSDELIQKSLDQLSQAIDRSQILMLVGGFSAGDEPDGSGKFIASVLQEKRISSAIERLRQRKGLILGICNGFQALVKAGYLPGRLVKNDINRHISHISTTRVVSTTSPWLRGMKTGDCFNIAISHGEGKYVVENIPVNQIAFQYVDNPNGSKLGIEGVVSEDGLILGKMGHSERYEPGLFLNIPGEKKQALFENGVAYFQGEQA